MKCHIESLICGPFQGTIEVLVESDSTFENRLDGWEDVNDYRYAAHDYLTRCGAELGVEWFEDPGIPTYRMVKHPVGDSYACVAVVPFRAKVAA